MEQEFDVIEVVEEESNEVITIQPSSSEVSQETLLRDWESTEEPGVKSVVFITDSNTEIATSRSLVSTPVPKKRSSLLRSSHIKERRNSGTESQPNPTFDSNIDTSLIDAELNPDNPHEGSQITSSESSAQVVVSDQKLHNRKHHKHARRKALLHEPDEIKAMLKTLTPLYRRRLMIELIKSRWYFFVLPLVILIVIGVVASVFILPMLAEETMIEVFKPPAEIEASWTVESTSEMDLSKMAENFNSNETKEIIENRLKPEMLRVYQSSNNPISDIKVLGLFQNNELPNVKRKRRSVANLNNYVIKHVIIPSNNKTDYKTDEAVFDLPSMVKTVRRELVKNKVFVADPGKLAFQQGSLTARSVSVEDFLQQTLPPVYNLGQHIDIPNYLSIHGGTKLKGCEQKPEVKNQLEILNSKCNASNSFEHGTKCDIKCNHPLLIKPVTAQCLNGSWIRSDWCYYPCPFVEIDTTFSVWPYKCTGGGDSPEPLRWLDRCTMICKKGYIQTTDITTKTCMEDGNWDVELADCKRSCPLLTPPSNGFVQPRKCFDWPVSQLVVGDVCTFSCDDSLVLEGKISTTCDNNGRWTEEVPVCRRKCKILEHVPNAVVHPSACTQSVVFDGMACTYTCQPGLQLVGATIRTCDRNGDWSEIPPQCRHTCLPLNVPLHGMIYPTSCSSTLTTSPGTCAFSCDTGYVESAEVNILTCLYNGEWDYPTPRCKSQCHPILPPQNGSLLCTGNVEDSTCKLYCDPGYKSVGSTYIICSEDGLWSEPIGNCKSTCPMIPNIPHAYITPTDCSMTKKIAGDICEYHCELLYGYNGPRRITCLEDGNWSANTTCDFQNQFLITMKYNNIHVCLSSVRGLPAKIKFDNCKETHSNLWSIESGSLIKNAENGLCIGFTEVEPMSSLVFLKCNISDPTQQWSWPKKAGLDYTLKLQNFDLYLWYGYPTSQNVLAISFPTPLTRWQIYDIDTKMTTSLFGITNNGKCFVLTQMDNGRWSPAACITAAVRSGTKCTFLCSLGYEINEVKSSVTCLNGVYTGSTSPKCVKSCTAFSRYSIRNGSVSPEHCTSNSYVRSGSICSFHCDIGFSIYGEPNVACLVGGQWSTKQPHCRRQCQPIVIPLHLKITSTDSCPNPTGMSEVGAKCGLACTEGYTIKGSRIIECNENGSWNDTSYSCVRACAKPNSPVYGAVTCDVDGFPMDSTCTFTCVGSMRIFPIDKSSITCQENGLWNSSSPTCQHFCPTLLSLPNGTINPSACLQSDGLPNLQKCIFECDVNKRLVGKNEAVCLSNGQWSNALPTCVIEEQFLLTTKKGDENNCISVAYYKHQNSYFAVKKSQQNCAFNNSMDRWSKESTGLIRHVGTYWCLGVEKIEANAELQLTECNPADDKQRFECEIVNGFSVLKVRNTNFYLHQNNLHTSIDIQKIELSNSVNWISINSIGNEGSVCGMLTPLGQCPELVTSTGSNLSPYLCHTSVDIGTTCDTICDEGYTLNSGKNSTEVTCLNLGVWSHLDVNCRRTTCPKLTLSAHGLVSDLKCINNSTAAWSSTACEVTCSPGVFRTLAKGATGTLYCLDDGVWSEEVPECLEYCPPLNAPNNGVLYPSNCTIAKGRIHGETCHFKCNTHYYLTGDSKATCNSGSWDISAPTCNQISGPNVCSPMSAPDYGRIVPLECSFSSVRFDTSCTASCDVGFIAVPQDLEASICQANGAWSRPLAECRKLCPRLAPPRHATIEPPRCSQGHNTKGDECTVICDPGYALGYSRTITCLSNGQWDEPMMQCSKKNQFLIEFKASLTCLSAVDMESDWVTKSDCNLIGDTKLKWEWLENTKIRNVATQKCLAPENLHRFSPIVLKKCNSISHPWHCSFNINFQQQFSYDNNILLFMPSTTPRAFSIKKDTFNTSLVPSTWDINARNETNEGSICLFKNHGNCASLPAMDHGYLRAGCHSQNNILIGTQCRYYCNSGYEMIGGFKTVCTANGVWSNTNVGSCHKLCPALTPPPNSVLTPSSCDIIQQQTEGSICNYNCKDSFILSGSTPRVCRADGKWSGVNPICIKNCPPITSVENLIMSPEDCSKSNQEPGFTCSFNCPTGYNLVGSRTRTCLSEGIWTGNKATCIRSCPSLSSLTNGRILPLNCVGTSKVISETCVYACNSIYSLTANKIRVCTAEGIWSSIQPKCKRTCKTPNAPVNGKITCEKTPGVVGSKCVYTCLPNYVLDGETNERTCLENGFWSHSQPICARSFQFLLLQSSPPNKLWCLSGISSTSVNMKLYQFCDLNNPEDRWEWYHKKMIRNGYYRTCLSGKIQQMESHLIIKPCDDTDPNQRWDCNDPDRSWFIRLTISKLFPLFSLLSKTEVLLFSNENLKFIHNFEQNTISIHTQWYAKTLQFNRTGVCTAISESECAPLQATQGLMVSPVTCALQTVLLGAECHFSCPHKQMVSPDIRSTTCLKHGSWSENVPKCVAACPSISKHITKHLKPSPTKCLKAVNHPESSTCKFTCSTGYKLLGSSMITCMNNSKWTSQTPMCKITCPPGSPLDRGTVEPEICTDFGTRPVAGTRCYYSCHQEELKLSGPSYRECLSTEKWSNPEPTCQKPCPAFTFSNQRKVIPASCLSKDCLADTVCAFSCDENMIQTGSQYRVCLSNGTWSGTATKCLTPCKQPENIPENSMLNDVVCLSAKIPIGFSCSISCLPGYERRGKQSITCKKNGTWSGQFGDCVKRCPKLARSLNSILQPSFCLGDDIIQGSECVFSCQEQFIGKGQSVKLCQEDGQWSKGEFTCQRSCPILNLDKSVKYQPGTCSSSLQVPGTECVVSCPDTFTSKNGDISKTLVCGENGEWDQEPIQNCIQTCNKPIREHGTFSCIDNEGKFTNLYTEGTICTLTCNDNYGISGVESSLCTLNKNLTTWSPGLASCVYQPDSMIIFNRVEFSALCLGEEESKVVLIDWEDFSSSQNIKWMWYGKYLIKNTRSGKCMSVSEPAEGVYLTTEICNGTNILQQWDCDVELVTTLKLRNFSLTVNTENGDGAVLRNAISKRSLMYSFNPNSDTQIGSICSMRQGSKCPMLWLPFYAQAVPLSCGKNESKAGTVCGVRCLKENSDIINIICDFSGAWVPDSQSVCKPFCSQYPSKNDLTFLEPQCLNSLVPMGTICTLSCTEGKVISRPVTTTCTTQLNWTSLTQYRCNQPCEKITSVENGYLKPKICTQEMCTVNCNAGYRVQGSKNRICDNIGIWSGSKFTCIPDVQFSIFSVNEFKGKKLCLEANSNSLVFKRPCKANYKHQLWRWSSHSSLENVMYEKCLTFDEKEVLAFNLSGRINNIGTNNTNEINFIDDVGSKSKVMTYKCDSTNPLQQWRCGDNFQSQFTSIQQIDTNSYLDAGPIFRTGLNIRKENYKSTLWKGEHYTGVRGICGFRKTGVCHPLKNIYGGKTFPPLCLSDLIIEGTRCQFVCQSNFSLKGSSYAVCQANGKWSEEIPVCIGTEQCVKLPKNKNLRVFPQSCEHSFVAEGIVCNMQCKDNAFLVGDSQITCSTGGIWNGTLPSCDVICPAIIPPQNGRTIPVTCEDGNLPLNFNCNTSCDAEFVLIGSQTRTCIEDGIWSGERAQCVPKCQPFGDILNGNVYPEKCLQEASNHGDTCTVECNHGFALHGTNKVICKNGKWNHFKPICSVDFCMRITSSQHSEITYIGLTNGAIVVNSIIIIECQPGYDIFGSKQRMCLDNGKWEGGNETCVLKKCPPLNELYHGTVNPADCTNENGGLVPGESCYFSCNEGYILSGPNSVKCPESGEWLHNEVPQCNDAHSESYFITFQMLLRGENINETCLESTKNTVYPILQKCKNENPFQLWNWYSGGNIQNIANELCLKMDGQRLTLDTCLTNDTEQAVTCADNTSPSSKYHIKVGDFYLGPDLNGKQWHSQVAKVQWVVKVYNFEKPRLVNTNFTYVMETTVCNCMCGGKLTANSGDFASPNFPMIYPPFVKCKWTIKTNLAKHKLRIGFSKIKLGNSSTEYKCHDNLLIEGDQTIRICKSTDSGFSINSMTGVVQVTFSTSSKTQHRNNGFSVHWNSVPWPAVKENCGDPRFDFPVHKYLGIKPTASLWQTMVMQSTRRTCNAFLINERFVVTSAHCVYNFMNESNKGAEDPMIIYRFTKQTELFDKIKTRSFTKVRTIFTHPEFDPYSLKNDIALVMSRNEMPVQNLMQPICVGDNTMHKLTNCWAVQWSSDMLTKVASQWRFTNVYDLDILSDSDCKRRITPGYSSTDTETNPTIVGCARMKSFQQQTNRRTTEEGFLIQCLFNSNWYSAGVTSYRIGHNIEIYTDLRYYYPWIKRTLENAFYLLREEATNA